MSFSYIDEFNQESKLEKTICADVLDDMITPFELLVENFKTFLLGCGFAVDNVNKIKIVENE